MEQAYPWSTIRNDVDACSPKTPLEFYLQQITRALITIAEAQEVQMEISYLQLEAYEEALSESEPEPPPKSKKKAKGNGKTK